MLDIKFFCPCHVIHVPYSSGANPGPESFDPYVFEPPGSGSLSQRYGPYDSGSVAVTADGGKERVRIMGFLIHDMRKCGNI